MSHISAATKDLNIDGQLSTVGLWGGNDSRTDTVNGEVDLRVEGGAFIRKKMLVQGNIDCKANLFGRHCGNVVTDCIDSLNTQGIFVNSDLNLVDGTFAHGNVKTKGLLSTNILQVNTIQCSGNAPLVFETGLAVLGNILNTTLQNVTAEFVQALDAEFANAYIDTLISNKVVCNTQVSTDVFQNILTLTTPKLKVDDNLSSMGTEVNTLNTNVLTVGEELNVENLNIDGNINTSHLLGNLSASYANIEELCHTGTLRTNLICPVIPDELEFQTNIIPEITSTYTLGNEDKVWANIISSNIIVCTDLVANGLIEGSTPDKFVANIFLADIKLLTNLIEEKNTGNNITFGNIVCVNGNVFLDGTIITDNSDIYVKDAVIGCVCANVISPKTIGGNINIPKLYFPAGSELLTSGNLHVPNVNAKIYTDFVHNSMNDEFVFDTDVSSTNFYADIIDSDIFKSANITKVDIITDKNTIGSGAEGNIYVIGDVKVLSGEKVYVGNIAGNSPVTFNDEVILLQGGSLQGNIDIKSHNLECANIIYTNQIAATTNPNIDFQYGTIRNVNALLTDNIKPTPSIPGVPDDVVTFDNSVTIFGDVTVAGNIQFGSTPSIIGFPIGAVIPYGGTSGSITSGWVLCDGSLYDPSTYTALFAIMGNVYGGDGVTTFAVPDLRERVPVGAGPSPSSQFVSLGSTGGDIDHTISVAELPAHNHGATTSLNSDGPHTHTVTQTGINNFHLSAMTTGSAAGGSFTPIREQRQNTGTSTPTFVTSPDPHSHTFTSSSDSSHSHTITSHGGGGTIAILQPYLTLNYIIRLF